MDNYLKIEQKLEFGKIRESIALRCSTNYAKDRVSSERISKNPKTIEKRLSLTDEMRLICMFESSFPTKGFIDTIEFLKPLEMEASIISVENLNKLSMLLDSIKGIVNFFKNTKEENYPNLKEMSASIMFFPEISRRIDLILDKSGEIKDSASDELYKIRKS